MQEIYPPQQRHIHTFSSLRMLLHALASSKRLLRIGTYTARGEQTPEKLKRRLNKVRQYASGTTYLIEKAKRLFPIPHRWVTDTFTGTGVCVFDLCNNPYDAILRGLHHPSLSPEIVDKLDKLKRHGKRTLMVPPTLHFRHG